jgi:DNA-binding GntR family transcriptional regulator
MERRDAINLKLLREQVYDYLRRKMNEGELLPGSSINMESLSSKLGISKTPLRDALIQLDLEGFVTIIPRRGIIVNRLTIKDIKDTYQIIGALASSVIIEVWGRLSPAHIDRMKKLNLRMREAIEKDDFDLYYSKNLDFHNVYLNLSQNETLVRWVMILKQRLYDFPRRKGYVREWEESSIKEHDELIKLIEMGDKEGAAGFLRDVHWSFSVQEKFIKRYYPFYENEVRAKV